MPRNTQVVALILAVLALLALAAPALGQTAEGQDAEGPDGAPAAGAEESESEEDPTYWIWTHGILMSVAWVGIFPLGMLIAQNRWTSPLKKDVAKKNIWFWLHAAGNAAGLALVIAAIAIALKHMEIGDGDGEVANAHKIIGFIVFALVLLQVALGLIRPHPGMRLRPLFNIVHHNTGRVLLVLAWVNIWLGVAFWYQSGGNMNFLAWVVPLAVFQGILFVLYLGLWPVSMKNRKKQAASTETVPKREAELPTTSPAVANGAPVVHTNGMVQSNGVAVRA